jgi:hypothetical protein
MAVVEVHLREVEQLFDSLDPCPFYERDLDSDAEDYIVDSVRELREHRVDTIVVRIDKSSQHPDEEQIVAAAIHKHFERKAQLASRELKDLIRRGVVSLAIGLVFLGTLLVASETVTARLEPGAFATVLSQSLVIGGWVAMWRPLEIFLYDWWPIAGRRRLFARLRELPVRLTNASAGHAPNLEERTS